MASGSRRKRGNDEYVFIDGKAMRADEAVRIDVGDVTVPGQKEAEAVPGTKGAGSRGTRGSGEGARDKRPGRRGKAREALDSMRDDDALELTEEAQAGELGLGRTRTLVAEERRKLRRKYWAFGIALIVLVLFSLCLSSQHAGQFKSPVEVAGAIGTWVQLGVTYLCQNASYHQQYLAAVNADPYFSDTVLQVQVVFKYLVCGALLAISGMLYQNAFRNPIAAPSMLGVTNGINFALLILVLQFGYEAYTHTDLYYIYSIVGGIVVLALVLLGGKWISGKGRFNTVNLILVGTIISQLLGVLMQYIQANFMDEQQWDAFYLLQNATGALGPWMYGTLAVGGLAALVPIVVFRFRLNLISFSDDETRLLGVDPTKLRVLALSCGSLMVLAATLNSGQAAMISLVVPFLVRAVFGSEFRKQLGGNLLMGAIVLLICGDLSMLIVFDGLPVGLGPVVSIAVIPLFVWIMAVNQRTWD